jgi:hypothetical protein
VVAAAARQAGQYSGTELEQATAYARSLIAEGCGELEVSTAQFVADRLQGNDQRQTQLVESARRLVRAEMAQQLQQHQHQASATLTTGLMNVATQGIVNTTAATSALHAALQQEIRSLGTFVTDLHGVVHDHRFRFMDEDGNIYELCRLPMGHRVSPEMCHLLLSTVAGLPAYVTPSFRHTPGVNVDIWLDNVQASGSNANIKTYMEWLDSQAEQCRVKWKEADSYEGRSYTFLGVHFNHETHTVCC